MSNKEFVEELASSLNKINRDPFRFRKVDETRRNQMFVIEENTYSVPYVGKSVTKVVTVSLKIDTENMTYPLIDITYAFSSGEDYDLEMVYGELKRKILSYLLFAKNGDKYTVKGKTIKAINIGTMILEGYISAKNRLSHESE